MNLLQCTFKWIQKFKCLVEKIVKQKYSFFNQIIRNTIVRGTNQEVSTSSSHQRSMVLTFLYFTLQEINKIITKCPILKRFSYKTIIQIVFSIVKHGRKPIMF